MMLCRTFWKGKGGCNLETRLLCTHVHVNFSLFWCVELEATRMQIVQYVSYIVVPGI
jgi:hypothetical protein